MGFFEFMRSFFRKKEETPEVKPRDYKSINIELREGMLFFIPVAFAGLGKVQYEKAVCIPDSATDEEKARVFAEVFAQAGEELPSPDDWRNLAPSEEMLAFLKKYQIKNWAAFIKTVLNMSVTHSLDTNTLEFSPREYDNGGFSGLKQTFEIPADSSPQEIAAAIEKGLSLCIGKGGLRKTAVVAAEPPKTDAGGEFVPEPGPESFGYKSQWLAVRATESEAVAKSLGIVNLRTIDWYTGLRQAEKQGIFITPSVDGWVLVTGWGLEPLMPEDGFPRELVERLSAEFGEAQFFATHRGTDYHCWSKACGGKMQRAYCFCGSNGETLFLEGEPTPVEASVELINTLLPEDQAQDWEDENVFFPDEDFVMQVAEAWSVNPMDLGSRDDIPGMGYVGESG